MKVNIQYQIDLKDLPTVVANLLNEVYLSLSKNKDTLIRLSELLKNGADPSQILSEIGLFREFLANDDKRLDDISCMLAQYQQTESDIFFAKRERDIQVSNDSNNVNLGPELASKRNCTEKTTNDIQDPEPFV